MRYSSKILLMLIGLIFLCFGFNQNNNQKSLDNLAIEYLKLGLTIKNCYPSISFYYRGGPDSLTSFSTEIGRTSKPIIPMVPKDSLINKIESLKFKLSKYISSPQSDETLIMRAKWIDDQLSVFEMEIRIARGENFSFDDESLNLFGVQSPTYEEQYYKSTVTKLDKFLPGEGTVSERYLRLSKKFNIPKDKIDTVFKTIIAESRRRTKERIQLPEGESFKLKYVTGEVWAGGSIYLGNNSSLIQVNLDVPINIYRAVDIACHEGYPGHHVYSIMMDRSRHQKGWIELSMRTNAQDFISEGIANYGIEMVFPGDEFNKYIKEVLIPLANLDTTDADLYFKVRSVKNQMKYYRNEIARGLLNGTMSSEEILKWQIDYGLLTNEESVENMEFINKNRSYIISYNYGEDLVRNYVEAKSGHSIDLKARWQVFSWLISNSNLVSSSDLVNPFLQ